MGLRVAGCLSDSRNLSRTARLGPNPGLNEPFVMDVGLAPGQSAGSPASGEHEERSRGVPGQRMPVSQVMSARIGEPTLTATLTGWQRG
jgi:hypothetical protein